MPEYSSKCNLILYMLLVIPSPTKQSSSASLEKECSDIDACYLPNSKKLMPLTLSMSASKNSYNRTAHGNLLATESIFLSLLNFQLLNSIKSREIGRKTSVNGQSKKGWLGARCMDKIHAFLRFLILLFLE